MDLLQGYSSSEDNDSENEIKNEPIVSPMKIIDIAPPVDFFGLLPAESESDDNQGTNEQSESELVADEPLSSDLPISKPETEIVKFLEENKIVEDPVLEESTKRSSIDCIDDESSSSSYKSKHEDTPKTLETESMDVDDVSKKTVTTNEIIDLDSDDIESKSPTPEQEIEKKDEIPDEKQSDSKILEEDKIEGKTEVTPIAEIENVATIELTDSDNENDVEMATPSVEIPSIPTPIETPAVAIETITEPTESIEPISKEIPVTDSKTYTNKDCINYDCSRKCKTFFICPVFILNFFTIPKKPKKLQFVCEECYDQAVASFEELCGSLEDHQPLLWQKLPNRVEHVDICDSDEEEQESDKRYMTAEELKLLSDKFEDSLAETLARVNITQQMKWTEQIIRKKINANEAESNKIAPELKRMQKLADEMYHSLYNTCEARFTDLEPLDLNNETQINSKPIIVPPKIPISGPVIRESIKIGETYYAVRQKFLSAWTLCEVMDTMDGDTSVSFFLIFNLQKIEFFFSLFSSLVN